MKMPQKNILLAVLILAAAVATTGGLLLEKILDLDAYKNTIIETMQRELKREVRYRSAEFSWRFGPSFTFKDVMIMERGTARPFVGAKRLTFKIALLPLLQREVSLKELLLDQPNMHVVRDREGNLNFSDLLEQKQGSVPFHINRLRIRNGAIGFIDYAAAPEGVAVALTDIHLSLAHFARGKQCSFKLSTLIGDERNKERVTVQGSAKLASVDRPLTETDFNFRITGKNIEASPYWPYYRQYVPFQKVTGQLTMDAEFTGKLASFTSRGNFGVRNLFFNYPEVFRSVLTPKTVQADYQLQFNSRDLTVSSLDLNVDGLQVHGNCALRDIPSGDLRITARAGILPFRLEDFRQYIPYGIIVTDTAEFIERHIKGGIYRLDEGVLDGRVSQIAHMERGENYNVLYVRARVEKGLLTFGREVPPFNQIRGELELRGKDFNLNRMSGNFGSSPFTLEGKITDYPLDRPSGYPFKMVMTPHQEEVAWLLDRKKTGKLVFSGPSVLHLSGEGFTSGYNLDGDWDLSSAAFSYPNIVNKPAGRTSNLSFLGSISKEEMNLSRLSLNLSPLSLAATANHNFSGKERFLCELKTNQFLISEIAPMLPKLSKYQPAGKVRASIRGAGKPEDIHWSGEVSLTGASLKPSANISTLSGITGTVRFKDESLESSYLTTRLGNSVISGKGSLTGFRNPSFSVEFSSPLLHLSDLGFSLPKGGATLTSVYGNLSLNDNNLKINSLTASAGNSSLSIKGMVQDLQNPTVEVAATSPYLDLGDVLPLMELKSTKTGPEPPTPLRVTASLSAEAGKAGLHSFEKLKAKGVAEDSILYLQSLESNAYGGRITAKGRFDFTSKQTPRYHVGYSIERMSAERLTKAIGASKQEISGTLSASGELTAKGETIAELKKTALGSAHLEIEDGALRRFAVLSKVFSILNISQLFKGRLPEMVSGGMPYNRITADLAIRDGVVSSQDLFVDSNAINMSAVGKLDVVRNEIDVTIGVQPLQTVDKVVSRLPLIGWVLTGKDKALITYFVEVKGNVDNPSVKVVPVKAMAKGVFDVFKRLFQLPAKLITDTGEVITGK
ncbi:AsmA-like C-terminal domain-containing protein [Geobacter sp. DSM 9736]|uniref:YhdP family protein n=1 Tax=Geobacter sp. DSM 9736 TaxID=1277350 RepID=UPI000B5099BE|nr:AsmA-like C-terminal domain-containing protein [Geobacter sp. DSM 9736]SNB46343.1 Protein of unknown function [Geobacter sp. DSM 9736]